MIFSIDVRNRICKKHDVFMQYVNLRADLKILQDDEEDSAIVASKLKDARKILDEIIEIKKEDMSEEIHNFKEEFAKDVLEHKELYLR